MNKGISTIFIMLGSDCNANCTYCMQGDKETKICAPLPKEIDNSIYHFIDDMCMDTIKHRENGMNGKFTVLFFGGEPLLYLNKIKEIVERLERMNSFISFSIITNGILIDKEVSEYLNKHNFHVTLSWDGKNSKEIRGYDIFNMGNAEHILMLNQLSLNAIISNKAYPEDIFESFAEVNAAYSKIHGYPINPMTEPLIIESKCSSINLDEFDNDKIYKQSKDAVLWYLNVKEKQIGLEPETYPKFKIMESLYQTFKGNQKKDAYIFRESCCCGWWDINIDLAGNLYPCHNIKKSLGNINDIGMNEYFMNLMEYETKETFSRKECNGCEVKHLCEGGCKMVTDETKERYCTYKKNLYRGILDGIKEYEEET